MTEIVYCGEPANFQVHFFGNRVLVVIVSLS